MTNEKPSLPSAEKMAAAILYDDELSPVEAIKDRDFRVARLVLEAAADMAHAERKNWSGAAAAACEKLASMIYALDVEKLLEGK
jgi:predicted KAP-like P-loop ATPase